MLHRSFFRRWGNLPLRYKGLCVVAIPIIPLLVLSALVVIGADRDQAAQAAVARTLQIKTEIASVYGLMADAETGVSGYLLTRQPESLKVLTDTAGPLQSHYERLRDLVADDAAQVEHLKRVNELSKNRPLNALLEFAEAHPQNERPPLELLAKSRATMAGLRAELGLMQEREDQLLAAGVATAVRTRERLQRLTLTSVVIGGLAGVFAVMAFTRGVTRRVDVLRLNATRLAAGDSLAPPVVDGDEVGQLDGALHEASSLLQQRERELTERMRDLEAARGELSQFFNVSLDLLCIAGMDGKFRRVNPAWQTVLGWRPDQLRSVPFVDFVHPDDVAATEARMTRFANGEEAIGFENRYRCSDGSYRWLSWKAKGDPERGVIYAAARDVTTEKQTAVDLEHRVMEMASLNQELEAFTYSVSHDLRAPLRHVSGFADLLEQHAASSLDAQALRYLTTIKTASSRMGRLIDDLLDFSRMGRASLSKREVDLGELVSDAQKELHAEIAGRTVRWRVDHLPRVYGDPAMLRLVVINLISNALKYTRPRDAANIDIGTFRNERGDMVFYVRDNGVGFDMQYVHKLFGVFQRLHRAEEFDGTGIGLANVRRIIHRHGGVAWGEGVIDQGATFYFSLPVHEGTERDDRAA